MKKLMAFMLVLFNMNISGAKAESKACSVARIVVAMGSVMNMCKKMQMTGQAFMMGAAAAKMPGQKACQAKVRNQMVAQLQALPADSSEEKILMWCEMQFYLLNKAFPNPLIIRR